MRRWLWQTAEWTLLPCCLAILSAPGCVMDSEGQDSWNSSAPCGCVTYEELISIQREAITNLQAIHADEMMYWNEYAAYAGSFSDLPWAPEGDTRYSYFLVDETIQASIGGPYLLPRGIAPAAGPDDFAALAVSNIDCDPVLDIFIISKNGFVVSVNNDITE